MRCILFDENVPEGVRRLLAGYVVETAAELGLAGLANGDLIEAAEKGGFDVMVTADQNLRYQQNLAGRRLALVILTTNHWDMIRPHGRRVIAAVEEQAQAKEQDARLEALLLEGLASKRIPLDAAFRKELAAKAKQILDKYKDRARP